MRAANAKPMWSKLEPLSTSSLLPVPGEAALLDTVSLCTGSPDIQEPARRVGFDVQHFWSKSGTHIEPRTLVSEGTPVEEAGVVLGATAYRVTGSPSKEERRGSGERELRRQGINHPQRFLARAMGPHR